MPITEQWLAGRDFARDNAVAAQMVNFVYFLGDAESKRAWLIDPAWAVDELVQMVGERGYELAGALLTHWHPDHAGGDLFGLSVEGARELHERTGLPVHAHREEASWLAQVAQLPESALRLHDADAELRLGSLSVRCVHTPGHTPGSTCYLVPREDGGWLFTGDVLFVGSCGRVDLPGSDPEEMARSLTVRLAALDERIIVYPGHDYGDRPTSTLGEERATNPYLRPGALAGWG
jgi:hydroxyacylglutathione hydrolase